MLSGIIRRPEVCQLTGLSNSTIYRLERLGRFPSRRRLSENSVGWVRAEVEDWISQRAKVDEQNSSAASL